MLGGNFATAEGIGVGMTVAELAAKYADLACKFERYDPNPEDLVEALFCATPKYAHVSFPPRHQGLEAQAGRGADPLAQGEGRG